MPVMKAYRKDKSSYGVDLEITEEQLAKCMLLDIIIRGSADCPGKCYILQSWDDVEYTFNTEVACDPEDKRMFDGRLYFDTAAEAIEWWVKNK